MNPDSKSDKTLDGKLDKDLEEIHRITVVGAGNMGHQIGLLCALNGYDTVCTDISKEVLKQADTFVDTYLTGRVESGGGSGPPCLG